MGLKTPIQISEDDVWEIDIVRKGYVSPQSVKKNVPICLTNSLYIEA